MLESNIKTPGVYINEVNAFPNAVVAVATAVPAFIGYTPQAIYEGRSYVNVPMKITSFGEFKTIFCLPDPDPPADTTIQYTPDYYLVKQSEQPEKGDYMIIAGDYYSIVPDPNSIYYMYNSIQLFYQNGGGDAYIVSVGPYGSASGTPMAAGEQIINPNVVLSDLTGGLAQLKNEQAPTMYICPEATLLTVEENGTLMATMLKQSLEMQTAISVFDIIGGRAPTALSYEEEITTFRANTGTEGLSYGTAYYPFVGTTIMENSDFSYKNLFAGDTSKLEPLLNPPTDPNPVAATILTNIENPSDPPLTVSQNNNALLIASPTYASIINHIKSDSNLLPPSAGMAGIMATIDNSEGVWQSPANTSMVSVVSLPYNLSETQQGVLNVDAVTGKSINAIRLFNGGLGILVWGARTLDGNSLDWRYLGVRRTMIMIEQSCKLAAQAYVFDLNVKNTWEAVKSMIGSFLNTVWSEGGLQGAVAADAYSVECGLGSTMTGEDILKGFMKVSVKVAVVRPAEFIIINFQQQMATSS